MDDQPPQGDTPPQPALDATAAAMLAAFRDEEQIPGALHERVWDRVELDVAAASSTAVAGSWVTRLVVGGLSVAAAVALVWVSADALQATESTNPSGQASYQTQTPTESGVAQTRGLEEVGDTGTREHGRRPHTNAADAQPETVEPETVEPETVEPETVEPATVEPRAPAPKTVVPSSTSRSSRKSTPQHDEPTEPAAAQPAPKLSTLGQEIALIERARKALLAHTPGEAIKILREHADQFPKGAMSQERRALHAIAGCERDGTGGAKRGQRFLEDHPTAALADRVRSACEID